MTVMRGAVVVGLAALAAVGTAAPAVAAPEKQPVTPQQCAASKGKVQRADDGVGTCVGGTQYDGHVISDVGTTRQQAAPQQAAPQQQYYYAPPQYAPAPQYYYAPAPAPAPQTRAAPAPSSSSTTPGADTDGGSDDDEGDG